jgi:hypothetical protein
LALIAESRTGRGTEGRASINSPRQPRCFSRKGCC